MRTSASGLNSAVDNLSRIARTSVAESFSPFIFQLPATSGRICVIIYNRLSSFTISAVPADPPLDFVNIGHMSQTQQYDLINQSAELAGLIIDTYDDVSPWRV